jgi:hypothetical protein
MNGASMSSYRAAGAFGDDRDDDEAFVSPSSPLPDDVAVTGDEPDPFEPAPPAAPRCALCDRDRELDAYGMCPACAGAEPIPAPSDAEVKLAVVVGRNRESMQRWIACEAAAREAKGLKAAAEAFDEATRSIINGFDEVLPLFDKPADPPAPTPDPEAWRSTPILELGAHGLKPPLLDKLIEAGFANLGHLADHTAEGKPLTAIKGLGPAKAEAVERALAKFWEANRAH